MDCKKYKKLLDAHIFGLLEEKEEKILQAHLENCQDCKKELMVSKNYLEKIDNALPGYKVNETLDKIILEKGRTEISRVLADPAPDRPGVSFQYILAGASVFVLLFILIMKSLYGPYLGALNIGKTAVINGKEYRQTQELYSQADIRITPGSQALLKKRGQYSIVLSAQSEIKIKNNGSRTILDYKKGRGSFDINKPNPFLIRTFNSRISIIGTRFILSVDPVKESTVIQMVRGKVSVKNIYCPEKSIEAGAGMNIEIFRRHAPVKITEDPGAGPQKKTAEKISIKIKLSNGKIYIGENIFQNNEKLILRTKDGEMDFKMDDIVNMQIY